MSQETLLLVDDEAHVVEALVRTLRNGGYRILEAHSGANALEVLGQEQVDLVISDIAMPEMSGLELMSAVRRSHPDVARIILTGFASLDSAITAINDGHVDRYLTKPWENDEIRSVIRETLDGRRPSPSSSSSAKSTLGPPLSPRLQQTLDRLLRGMCPKEIATDLGVSGHTVHQYVKVLYRRFDVTSRAQLLAKVLGGT